MAKIGEGSWKAFWRQGLRELRAATRESRKKRANLFPRGTLPDLSVACLTGLRKQEMARLTASSFRLDDSPPTVTVAAAVSKHRRKDVLPLHPELVSQLRQWLKGLKPDDKLFPSLGKKQLSVMIQKDLKRAGIPYRTAEGIADFHAAGRHTYITQLLRSGATLPEAKELARHTDVRMPMRHTHIGIGDQARAVGNLPMPSSNPKAPARAESHQVPALQMRCISGGAEGHSVAPFGIKFPNDERLNPRDTMSLGVKCLRLPPAFTVHCTGKMPDSGFVVTDVSVCTCDFCQGFRAAWALQTLDTKGLNLALIDADLLRVIDMERFT